ncbi:MAG: TlpA family protein disulfide reductase [Bacteroidota bacterium]|nr:TlpA family protein disulfide reductase [Bacteroidota bacterium]
MKKILFALILLVSLAFAFGQNKVNEPKPFILKGQLSNYNAARIHLAFNDKNGKPVDEIIPVDNSGKFYFETTNIARPEQAALINSTAFFNSHLFIAPGYELNITADCKDWTSVARTKKVSGNGVAANQYLFKRDSILSIITPSKDWVQLNTHDLLQFINSRQKFEDSLANIIFTKKITGDDYLKFFGKKVHYDIEFLKLDQLTYHTVMDTSMHYQQSVDFVAKYADHQLLDDLYKPEYLVSDDYITFMRDGYCSYLRQLELKKDPLADDKKYMVDYARIVAGVYKGKIKDIVLNHILHESVEHARSFDEMNMYKKEYPFYIAQLVKPAEKESIEKLIGSKEKELLKTQIGRPAPLFTAENEAGKSFNITDYKGKVVLLDLWASWCGPCRQETPYLKKTIEKYKNEGRVVFISVAVLDKLEKWKKAMTDDNPLGLQLFDTNNTVQRAYVANSIPKFILIDKQGNIVSFDAPMPHETAALEKMLDEEISK